MRVDVYDGYMQMIGCNHDADMLKTISDEIGYSNALKLTIVSLKLRAPLFVRIGVSNYTLDTSDVPKSTGKTFVPDVSMISSGNNVLDREIAEHIRHMSETATINVRDFQRDGCDRFVAQLVTPINTYVDFYATMTLDRLIKFSKLKLPVPMQRYVEAAADIVCVTWPHLQKIKEKIGNGEEDLKKRTRTVVRLRRGRDDNLCVSCERSNNPEGKGEEIQKPTHKSDS
jgi:hypothetical protein